MIMQMTETEWMTCNDSSAMLQFLWDGKRLTERKSRLFSATCCRRVSHLLADRRSRDALELAEKLAENPAGWREIDAAQMQARDASKCFAVLPEQRACYRAASAVCNALRPRGCDAGMQASWEAARAMSDENYNSCSPRELKHQAGIIRDIFGPLLFRPKSIDHSLLTWNFNTIPLLARAAYEERHLPSGTLDSFRLGVLADALEEAGCTDAELLDHFRRPGTHYRGCWGLDLILGKS
jgi:hypothetical protein